MGGLLFFAVGSAMCGAASNMMLVALTCFARVEGLRHITFPGPFWQDAHFKA